MADAVHAKNTKLIALLEDMLVSAKKFDSRKFVLDRSTPTAFSFKKRPANFEYGDWCRLPTVHGYWEALNDLISTGVEIEKAAQVLADDRMRWHRLYNPTAVELMPSKMDEPAVTPQVQS